MARGRARPRPLGPKPPAGLQRWSSAGAAAATVAMTSSGLAWLSSTWACGRGRLARPHAAWQTLATVGTRALSSATLFEAVPRRRRGAWLTPDTVRVIAAFPRLPRSQEPDALVVRHAARRKTATTSDEASEDDDAEETAPARKRTPIPDLQIGQELEGTVVQWFFPGGVTVDVGATAEGFLEVEEFRDGFPDKTIPETFTPGDKIKVRVLDLEDYTIAESAKFHLTLRTGDLERPARYVGKGIADVTPFLEASPEDWFDGEVTLMSTWACFVKVVSPGTGKPFVGILYKEDFAGAFEDEAIRGGTCRVRVKEVDTENRRLIITMKDPSAEAAAAAKDAEKVPKKKAKAKAKSKATA
eukprot:TRINITY_DN24717_c0_g1_i1.p1 TRINITY_DN24717_c0_g1~~TRINITY_DN24717_c0_g1_i1.p1  ORF type:complete len:357 (+),score=88.94 TRINITY_DN24717_c0_g1_i1:38-1108(+)